MGHPPTNPSSDEYDSEKSTTKIKEDVASSNTSFDVRTHAWNFPWLNGMSANTDDANQAGTSTTSYLPHVPPYLWLSAVSIPCWYRAYTEYKKPLLSQDAVQVLYSETAEEGTKRAAASQIATRALRVATWSSVGMTTAVTAVVLYAAGYASLSQAMYDVRAWARQHLNVILQDDSPIANQLGIHPDRSHPDFAATRQMTDEQEMEYLADKYFAGQDWTQPDGLAKEKKYGQWHESPE